jgi:hypothetical protein
MTPKGLPVASSAENDKVRSNAVPPIKISGPAETANGPIDIELRKARCKIKQPCTMGNFICVVCRTVNKFAISLMQGRKVHVRSTGAHRSV